MLTMTDSRFDLKQEFNEYASTRDETLRARLIQEHLGLAKHLARRFDHRGETYDDLVQVASLALIKAVDGFDPEVGVQFTTYATQTIIGELKRHFRDKGWAMRPARRVQELYLRLSQAIELLSQDLGRSPTIKELAVETQTSEEEVIEAIEAGQAYRASSLDAPGPDDEALESKLGAESGEFAVAEWRVVLSPVLDSLPKRDRTVLQLRFADGLTQSEIAERLGVSQMQISRLLARSLGVLRDAVSSEAPGSK
jgi:RNA polymerase sigma-B factor